MDRSGKWSRFFAGKGFYIALLLCSLVIGVTTYLAVRQILFGTGALPVEEPPAAEPSVGVPIPRTDAREETPPPVVIADEPPEADVPPDEPVSLEAEVVETLNPVLTQSLYTRPAAGNVQYAYSNGELVWSSSMEDWRVHTGMDFAGVTGSQVYAACDGTVEAVYCDALMGYTVVVAGEGGERFYYQNLTEAIVPAAGDFVRSGDVLGAIGRSATAEYLDEPHLHFEVRIEGVPVDPEPYTRNA